MVDSLFLYFNIILFLYLISIIEKTDILTTIIILGFIILYSLIISISYYYYKNQYHRHKMDRIKSNLNDRYEIINNDINKNYLTV